MQEFPDKLDIPSRLGVGPMSRNVLDSIIRLAYRRGHPMMVIASRSQVECAELGGGYVENWTTESFTRYVRQRDPSGLIHICRDHGGPWQHPDEIYARESEAMARSLTSLRADIRAGMRLLHLDTSRQGDGAHASFDDALGRLVELYAKCFAYANLLRRPISFEVGLERQGSGVASPDEFRLQLERILYALRAAALPLPTFVVAQTGTRVLGTQNAGDITRDPVAVGAAVNELADICRSSNVALKAHNVDYLSEPVRSTLLAAGTDAINIAPELGVTETRAVIDLLRRHGLDSELEEFLKLSHDSEAWRKWFEGDASYLEKAVVSGHYVFATERFKEIWTDVESICRRRGIPAQVTVNRKIDMILESYADSVFSSSYLSEV